MSARRILIVDDSLTIRRLAERVLRQEGFLTETAESIAEALVKLPLFHPDLVLLDYVLPDGFGTDACRALLADPGTESIPVVLISAKGGDIRQLYIDLPNVVDFVTKPFTPAVLVSMVAHVLQLRSKGSPHARPVAPGGERGRVRTTEGGEGAALDAATLLAGRTRLLPLDKVLDACQRDGGISRLDLRESPDAPPVLSLWMDAGRVAWARVAAGSLAGRAVREHLSGVAPEAVRFAELAEREEGTSAVTRLARNGLIDRSAAVALAREVALEALLECMAAEDLVFLVVAAAELPAEAEGLQASLSTDEVRMARLRRADAWHVIEEVIPSLDVVLIRAADAARQAARLCLDPVEESLLALVDGTRQVRDVVAESGGKTFDVCRVLYRLVEGGVVRIKLKRGEGGAASIRRVFVVDSDVERVYPGVVEALSELEQGIEVRCHRESLGRIPWAIRVYQPDALLLDVRLDGFDGVKLVKLLRHSAEFHSMLIVATGDGLSEEEERHLRRVGFSSVLPKPFLADQLCAAVLGDDGETSPADLGPGL